MDSDEIGVVLARASELHAKISEAIERALKSEFLLSTSGKTLDSPIHDADDYDDGYDSYERGVDLNAVVSDVNAEARSLGLIRDALEALEGQLEALQAMQQHQRAEKDAALAELEESRHILLQKLKDHRGQEWEVVQEALAFAGEPVEETDDLLLPPYPRPVVDPSTYALEGQSPPFQARAISLRSSRAVKKLTLPKNGSEEEDKDDINAPVSHGIESGKEECYQEQGVSPKHEVETEGGIAVVRGFLRGFSVKFGSVLVHATKAVFVVASVVAFLAFTEHNHRQVEQKARPVPSAVKPVLLPASEPKPPLPLKCPPGKKLILEDDGIAKCVVKERFELPFPREVKEPDVLYGRG